MSLNEMYRTDPQIGFEGMVADMSNAVIVSRTAEAAIGFGKAVARGTEAGTARVVAAGDTEIFGISVRSQATAAESVNEYPENDTVAVMRKGPIMVKAGGTVAVGDPVGVVVATGAFVVDAGEAPAGSRVAISGATFETAGAANDIVEIHII